MTILISILNEIAPLEKRVALTPEIVSRLKKWDVEIRIEAGAGLGAFFNDDLYQKAGAKIIKSRTELLQTDILLTVAPPSAELTGTLADKTKILGFLNPFDTDIAKKLCEKNITAFALELLPRTTRAQAMDALSSQATVMGYKAVLLAAEICPQFFPMLTTAAGTIRPAKVLVMGAGVAGLQAIATAKRLGAQVEAFDVRPASKEEVQSLGARFIEMPFSAATEGGYARELNQDEKKQQQEIISKHVAMANVVITTARIPGRPAPRLITEAMIQGMKPGALIIDLAADSGGNSAHTKPGETVEINQVKVLGPLNVASLAPVPASEMYAKNLFNFLSLLTKDGTTLEPDFTDDIIAGSVWTHNGEIGLKKKRDVA